MNAVVVIPSGSRAGSHSHLHSALANDSSTVLAIGSRSMDSLHKMKRTGSLKSNRSLGGSCPAVDDMIPPPPLPPVNSAFRKQVGSLYLWTLSQFQCYKLQIYTKYVD